MGAIRVNRQEFLNSLALVQPGLSTRALIQQSSCFVFENGWVSTYNEEVCCQTKSTLPKDLTAVVNAKTLLQILEQIRDEEFTITVQKTKIRIDGIGSYANLPFDSEVILPTREVEIPARDDWEELPVNFSQAIEQVVGTAGGESEEPICVFIHLTSDYIETTDRRQMTRYYFDLPIKERCLIRAKQFAPSVVMGLVYFAEADNWCHFSNKRPGDKSDTKPIYFSIRRHLDNYPTDALTGRLDQFEGHKMALPDGLDDAAKFASIFSADDKENNRVRVRLTERKMVVMGEGVRGDGGKRMDLTSYDGPDVEFFTTPDTLQFLIKNHKECEIGEDSLRVDGDSWTYLVLLGTPLAEAERRQAVKVGADEEPEETSDED